MIRQLLRYAVQIDLVVDITGRDTGLRDIARLHRLAAERRTALVDSRLIYPKRLMPASQDRSNGRCRIGCQIGSTGSICVVGMCLGC